MAIRQRCGDCGAGITIKSWVRCGFCEVDFTAAQGILVMGVKGLEEWWYTKTHVSTFKQGVDAWGYRTPYYEVSQEREKANRAQRRVWRGD